jgi:hypothetical protein
MTTPGYCCFLWTRLWNESIWVELHGQSAYGNLVFNALYNICVLPLCGRLFCVNEIKTPISQLATSINSKIIQTVKYVADIT